MTELPPPESVAGAVPLLAENCARFLQHIELPVAREVSHFTRSLVGMAPANSLVSPEYDGDAASYLEYAQNIYRTAQTNTVQEWNWHAVGLTEERRRELAELGQDWRKSADYTRWDNSLRGQMASPVTSSRTRVRHFFSGTQEIAAGAAVCEARGRYATDCEAIGRIMLSRMGAVADTPQRQREFRQLMVEAVNEAKQLPFESVLPHFWDMSPEQQRSVTAQIGSECLTLWNILGTHGSLEQLAGLESPRLVRPVADLASILPRIEGKARKVALVTAFVSEGASFEPQQRKDGTYPPIEPPQPGAFDAFVADNDLQPESVEGGLADDAELELNQTYALSEPGQRYSVPEVRRLIEGFVDDVAQGLYDPLQDYGVQRRLSWDADRSDFAALLCGNRPINVYDVRVTPLAPRPADVSRKLPIPVEDIRLFRLDASLKSTGKQPVANSLYVAVWRTFAKHAVQLRKKALAKADAAEVIARHHAQSAETASPRMHIVRRHWARLENPPEDQVRL